MNVNTNVFFVLTLPSSGKEVKFRPYLVKEEKGLIIAKTTGDAKAIFESIKNIVDACTFNQLDVETMPYFDLQYIFSMLRAKSVGEDIELVGGCDCSPEAKTDVFLNIEDVKYKNEIKKGRNIIELKDSEYSVSLVYPNINMMTRILELIDTGSVEEHLAEIVSLCIDAVFTKEEYFDSMTPTEKLEFIESLFPKQLKQLKEFADNLPYPYYDVEYDCSSCGKHHKTEVKGIERFFN